MYMFTCIDCVTVWYEIVLPILLGSLSPLFTLRKALTVLGNSMWRGSMGPLGLRAAFSNSLEETEAFVSVSRILPRTRVTVDVDPPLMGTEVRPQLCKSFECSLLSPGAEDTGKPCPTPCTNSETMNVVFFVFVFSW